MSKKELLMKVVYVLVCFSLGQFSALGETENDSLSEILNRGTRNFTRIINYCNS